MLYGTLWGYIVSVAFLIARTLVLMLVNVFVLFLLCVCVKSFIACEICW